MLSKVFYILNIPRSIRFSGNVASGFPEGKKMDTVAFLISG